MRHENRQVLAIGQMAGERCGGVQGDQRGALLEFVGEITRDFLDHVVRDCEDHYVGIAQRGIGVDAGDAQLLPEPLASRFAHLDVTDLVGCVPEIVGDAVAHLSARSDNRHFLHCRDSSLSLN